MNHYVKYQIEYQPKIVHINKNFMEQEDFNPL